MATEHLLQSGCKRVAYIGGAYVSTARDRAEGYRSALIAAGLPMFNEHTISSVRNDDAADETGYRAAKELLALSNKPDGIFCGTDPIAMGAMRAILEAGLRIPQDVCIVGVGNVRYARDLRVSLSTIDQDSALLGSRSAELALSLLQKDAVQLPREIVLRPKVIVRESSIRNGTQHSHSE
jgi:LacI family transcriptional regulator